jgi:hypothetical protein
MTDYNGAKFYFQYANPVETTEELSQQRRPTVTGAHPWECSVYYYWWQFLRLNDDYIETCAGAGQGPCSELYLDFGDIRDANFMHWWLDRGRQLFCEPHRAKSEVIEADDYHRVDRSYRLVVEIERFGDLERTLAEIRQIIGKQQPAEGHGRGGRNVSRALYQSFTKPVLLSLRKHLEVYELLKTQPDISNQQLVKDANLNIGEHEGSTGWHSAANAKGKSYRAEIARMIEYVAKGAFPIMTAAQAGKVPDYLEMRKVDAQERRREIAVGLHCVPFGPGLPPVPSSALANHGLRDFFKHIDEEYGAS